MRRLNIGKKWVLPLVLAGSVAGGALGGALLHSGSSSAAQGVTSSSRSSGSGTFHPNETPSHEANESKEREAQEDAGQFPTVP